MPLKYQWTVAKAMPEAFARAHPQYPPQALQVLFNRGIVSTEALEAFFASPNFSQLPDPFLVTDMEKAVRRLRRAKEEREHVVVFGDYDPDGACGAALLTELLNALKISASTYLPDRFREGYGLTKTSIGEILKRKASLVMMVDCGVRDVEEIHELGQNGIETLVIDHHIPPDPLPNAAAILDTLRADDQYPFKGLCGAGMAFVFAQAVLKNPLGRNAKPEFLDSVSDLVAVATVADMVPLVGPNRVLVRKGLARLRERPRIGFRALIEASRLRNTNIDAETLAFELGPRLNAASRMDHANTAFALLMSRESEQAATLARALDRHNRARRTQVSAMLAEIEERLLEEEHTPSVLVASDEKWSSSIISGVASKLARRHHRPVFLFSIHEGTARGSVRSIEGFDLVRAMQACGGNEFFQDFGGHPMAAGCTLRADWLPLFRERIEAYAKSSLTQGLLTPRLNIDLEISAHEVTTDLFSWLERLAPFGRGNPKPTLCVRNVVVLERKLMGRGETLLKLVLASERGGKTFSALARFERKDFAVRVGDRLDIVGELERDEWRGRKSVALNILDLKPHE